MGEMKLGAEFLFALRHFAFIGLVIVASEMKKAVKHQHLDFNRKGMTSFTGLTQRGGNADGQIAGDFERAGSIRRKRKHVGGFVLAAELPVEAADSCVGCEQDCDLPSQPRSRLRIAEKTSECTGTGDSLIAGREATSGTL
jgi:hypothetical protein